VGLILASTSPYRRELLMRLGAPFECIPSLVDEDSLKTTGCGPVALARILATEKANSLVPTHALDTIIGADQVVDLEGTVLGKPDTIERAVDQLASLSGRTHRLVTALAVWHDGEFYTHVDTAALTMRPISREAIARYIAADQPLDCAGSYKLEARGIALFERIESADHTAIIGLPLIALTTILRTCGYEIP
jgi:septum formation protein